MSPVHSSLLSSVFAGRVVWISGHTGFKGAWMVQWLRDLGAEVHGFSLAPEDTPSLFGQLGLAERINHGIGDLRDPAAVRQSILAAQPDFVFHLGAQALVRRSFDEPVATYMTNVLGTIHVLEALRELRKACAAVFITTDKCFENREWLYGYREEDPLGGHDPYSSSKAAAEIAIASWRRCFFRGHPVRVASARAGNVIGGGDWAKDRILPDCVRALVRSRAIGVRNKTASRSWQHVLEPLSGYLWLAAVLSRPSLRPYDPDLFASAFNFGPGLDSNRTVSEVVTEVLKHWPGRWEDRSDPAAVHEATRLNLAIDKAYHLLGWKPIWSFEKAIEATVEWYRKAAQPDGASSGAQDLIEITTRQIGAYQADAQQSRVAWA